MRKVDKVIVHCSDSPQGRGDNVEDIRRWHLARGWSDVGYHYVILEDGFVEVGRDIDKVGAHVRGHNRGSVGICLIGDKVFTEKQFESLRALVEGLKVVFGLGNEDVYGHNDFSSKTCPNFDVHEMWPS